MQHAQVISDRRAVHGDTLSGALLSDKQQMEVSDVIAKWGQAINTLKGIIGTAIVLIAFLVMQYQKINDTSTGVDSLNKRFDALQSERRTNLDALSNYKQSKEALDATQTEAINSLKDAIRELQSKR